MVTLGTAVFHRILLEREEQASKKIYNAAVKALKDTMQKETVRFGTFGSEYVEGCAQDRLEFYIRNSDATPTNLVIPINQRSI